VTPAQVRKLIPLAEHGKSRDMDNYARKCIKVEEIRGEIDVIRAGKRQYDPSNGGDFNALARWQRWVDAEISKLGSQHQISESEKEAARLVAIKSAAKVQALESLLKRALKEELVRKRRRAEQNGQPPDA